jgi:hypothetical protein
MQASGTALLCSMLAVVCYRSVEAHAQLSPCLSRRIKSFGFNFKYFIKKVIKGLILYINYKGLF